VGRFTLDQHRARLAMEFWCSFALRQQTFCEKGNGIGILSMNHRHRAFAASNIEQAQYLMIIDF
jgi:hypothetical protein